MGILMRHEHVALVMRARRRAEIAAESLNLRGVIHTLEAIKDDLDDALALAEGREMAAAPREDVA